jgi:HAD superfamily hydrolase (TIGR01509 family)
MAHAAIFDLDGTLVTFTFDVLGSRKAMLAELSKRGFDVSGLGPAPPTMDIIDTARRQIEAGKASGTFGETRKALYSILNTFELECCGRSEIFPGTRKALEDLRKNSIRLGLVTNNGRAATSLLLERNGLSSYFEFVLAREDVVVLKPSPDGLIKAISILGLPTASVVYVGDSVYDIDAAKKAGIKVISIATGNYSSERLRAEGADYVLRSISEVPRLIVEST